MSLYGGAAISNCMQAIRHHNDSNRRRSAAVDDIRRDAEEARDIGDLQREIAELKLHVATLVCLLTAKEMITEDEYGRITAAIDALDGVEDGRFDGTIDDKGGVDGTTSREDRSLRELAAVVEAAKPR